MADFIVSATIDALMQAATKLAALQALGQNLVSEFDATAGNVILVAAQSCYVSDPAAGGGGVTVSRQLTLPAISGYSADQIILVSDCNVSLDGVSGKYTFAATGGDSFGAVVELTLPGGFVLFQAGSPTAATTWNVVGGSVDITKGLANFTDDAFARLLGAISAGSTKGNLFFGTTTLISGTKDVIINGITSAASVLVTRLAAGGIVTTTQHYDGVPGTNKITINALTSGLTILTTDTSVMSYIAVQPK